MTNKPETEMVEKCARAICNVHRTVNLGFEPLERLPRRPESEVFWLQAEAAVDEVAKYLRGRIDMALLDFAHDDGDCWARGHAHAKSVALNEIAALSPTKQEEEGR